MAIKNFLFLLAASSLFLTACESMSRRSDNKPIIFSQNSQAMQSAMNKPEPQASGVSSAGMTQGGAPVVATIGEVLPVGVYFGPGAMRAFAHVGVLKALTAANVPVVSVGGVEWGSVVAGLYSFSKSANDVEWQMLKLRKDQLPISSFMKKVYETRESEALQNYLRFIFTDKNLENAKIPFECLATDGIQNLFLRTGKAWEQITKCASIPPFYTSFQGWYSGATAQGDWAENMIKDGAKFIIYVDVLGEEPLFSKSKFASQDNARMFWSAIKNFSKEQYRQANMILSVPINQDLLDFENRREAIKLGEKFASGVIPDLLKIIGVQQ